MKIIFKNILKRVKPDTYSAEQKEPYGVTTTFYLNSNNEIFGFKVEGETNYAPNGYDILASAISVLVINTANSINALTSDKAVLTTKDTPKCIKCSVNSIKNGYGSKEAKVLLKSLESGLKDIRDNYGEEYIQVRYCQK